MRLAKRLQAIQPSATLAMAARARALKAEGRPVISFTTGEPDFGTPKHIGDAGKRAIDEGFTKYTAAGGIPELKEAVRARIQRDYGLVYGNREVVISNGAKQAIFNALLALCDPGDEVVIFAPYWTSYVDMVRAVGGTPVIAPTDRESGFVPTPDALAAVLGDRTRLLILNSPNNPTGACYEAGTLAGIAGLLAGRDVVVISDDIYDRLIYGDGTFASYTAASEEARAQTVIVSGVSKSYAMTGWRIGYAAGPESVIQAMDSLQSHTTSNPNSIAQKAALAALTGPDDEVDRMRAEFDRRRIAAVAAIREIPDLPLVEPRGAFYVFPDVRAYYGRRYKGTEIRGSVALAEALLDAEEVVTVPGAAFGDDDAIRLSYALSIEQVEEGIARIRRFLTETLA